MNWADGRPHIHRQQQFTLNLAGMLLLRNADALVARLICKPTGQQSPRQLSRRLLASWLRACRQGRFAATLFWSCPPADRPFECAVSGVCLASARSARLRDASQLCRWLCPGNWRDGAVAVHLLCGSDRRWARVLALGSAGVAHAVRKRKREQRQLDPACEDSSSPPL